MNVSCPSSTFSESEGLLDVAVLRKLHPQLNPKGHFEAVSFDDDGNVFFVYKFEIPFKASDAKDSYFLINQKTVPVNKILAEESFQLRIDIQFVGITTYKEKMASAFREVRSLLSANKKCKVEDISEDIFVVQDKYLSEGAIECIDAKELTMNSYLRNRIVQIAEGLGYIVKTNKSAVVGKANQSSRCYTSRPDLSIISGKYHCGFTVIEQESGEPEEFIVTAATTENKQSCSGDEMPQLLGNMEKVAGDVVLHHLKVCETKLFSFVEVYGLIIDYNTDTCTAHKLKMDFHAKNSYLYNGDKELPLSQAIDRLITTLQRHSGEV